MWWRHLCGRLVPAPPTTTPCSFSPGCSILRTPPQCSWWRRVLWEVPCVWSDADCFWMSSSLIPVLTADQRKQFCHRPCPSDWSLKLVFPVRTQCPLLFSGQSYCSSVDSLQTTLLADLSLVLLTLFKAFSPLTPHFFLGSMYLHPPLGHQLQFGMLLLWPILKRTLCYPNVMFPQKRVI